MATSLIWSAAQEEPYSESVTQTSDERSRLIEDLRERGIAGADEFGRFVNNTEFFGPSTFDERTAMPVLLEALPRLTDLAVVDAVARHLGREWARPVAFWPLHEAFLRWSRRQDLGAWAIGESLVKVSAIEYLDPLLSLVRNPEHGRNLEMIVFALYRYKADPRVETALRDLVDDEDVSLHAISALRRVVSADAMVQVLERVIEDKPDSKPGKDAAKALKAVRKRARLES